MRIEDEFQEYVLPENRLKKLQKILLMMLKDVDYICKKYNIDYYLAGGSCLGAVRHKGFIPWDDDVDILMFSKDRVRFLKAIEQEMSEKYSISDFDYNGSLFFMTKIFLNDTKCVEILKDRMPLDNGVFIDFVFLENLPNNKFIFNLKSKFHKLFKKMYQCKVYYKYTPSIILEKAKKEKVAKRFLRNRKILGFFANFFSFKFYLRNISRLEKHKQETGKVFIAAGAYGYDREIFNTEDVKESILVPFEDMQLPIFKNYDMYLKNLYNNYMQLPPEDKRHRHIAVELDFGKYEEEIK